MRVFFTNFEKNFSFFSKMPIFYTTKSQTFKIFRDEEKKNCTFRIEVWAGNQNKLTCLNCIRKSDLKNELEKKRFLDK